jgi:hypothetical protein
LCQFANCGSLQLWYKWHEGSKWCSMVLFYDIYYCDLSVMCVIMWQDTTPFFRGGLMMNHWKCMFGTLRSSSDSVVTFLFFQRLEVTSWLAREDSLLLVQVPRRALYHFATMVGLGSFFCPRRFFYPFINAINAKSTVSTFNNTIELKGYIHECIFWGCSVNTFWEDNLAIFDHKIYP